MITIDTTPPIIDSGNIATPIEENSGAGQIVYTTTSTDESAVTYRLEPTGDHDHFTIDSGEVILKDNPDYETQSDYSFTVVATDAAGNSSTETVTLEIEDQVVSAPELIDESNGTVDGDDITNDTTPTFKGNAPAGSTVRVFVTGNR